MKLLLVITAAVLAAVNTYAQGTVAFANNAATAVTNSLTGARVATGAAFAAALYYAQDGAAQVNTQLGASVNFGPGVGTFNGGTRTTPDTTPGGGAALFQVKAWETAFGTSYEAALGNTTPIGGRLALVGNSVVTRINTGNPNGTPVVPPASLLTGTPNFQGFYLTIVPEPSVIGLGLLGAASLLLLRRRK